MGRFTEYLSRAGNFAIEAVRESAYRHDDEVIRENNDYAIMITTSALYESKVKDEIIIKMLQKYWGLTEAEAKERLRVEKTIQHPCNAVADYLMSEEAMTKEEADHIIIYEGVLDYLKEDKTAWKLSPKELLVKSGIHI